MIHRVVVMMIGRSRVMINVVVIHVVAETEQG